MGVLGFGMNVLGFGIGYIGLDLSKLILPCVLQMNLGFG